MSDVIEEKDKVLSFTLFKVEKGREKICKCNPPHYTIDTKNRIITCDDCGATLDAFEALMSLYKHIDGYREYQEKALEKCKTYKEWADKEWRRRMKNAAFKDMDKQYQSGMLPHCPKCGEIFDPMEITGWTNKKYVKSGGVAND